MYAHTLAAGSQVNGRAVPVEDFEAAAMWSGDPGEGNRWATAFAVMSAACEMLTDRTGELTLEAVVGFYLRKLGVLISCTVVVKIWSVWRHKYLLFLWKKTILYCCKCNVM